MAKRKVQMQDNVLMVIGSAGNCPVVRAALKKEAKPELAIVAMNTRASEDSLIALFKANEIPVLHMPVVEKDIQFRGYWFMKRFKPKMILAFYRGSEPDRHTDYLIKQAIKLRLDYKEDSL